MNSSSIKDIEQQYIDTLHKRLNWLITEPESPDTIEEIKEIRKILGVIEPEELDENYYNAEKGFERFKETLEIRMRIQDETRRFYVGEVNLADYSDEENGCVNKNIAESNENTLSEVKSIKNCLSFNKARFRKIAMVASLVAMLFIGGVTGVYAQREGFFKTLVNNDEKNLVVSTPSFNNKQMVYDNIENVPLKYISCLWTPTNIPKEMELKSVILVETEVIIKAYCEYKNDSDNEFITFKKNNYKNSIVLTDQLHDEFKPYKKESYDCITVEYLVKENDDYTEYIASFICDNCIYNLNSNCHFDIIEDIVEKSILNRNL